MRRRAVDVQSIGGVANLVFLVRRTSRAEEFVTLFLSFFFAGGHIVQMGGVIIADSRRTRMGLFPNNSRKIEKKNKKNNRRGINEKCIRLSYLLPRVKSTTKEVFSLFFAATDFPLSLQFCELHLSGGKGSDEKRK